MTPLYAILGFAGMALTGVLTYLATRKRDAPQLEVEQTRLKVEDSKAASEAWAEYATQVRGDLLAAREEAADCRRRVDTLTKLLDECIAREPKKHG